MSSVTHEDIAAVRRFNRGYTRAIGLLGEGLSQSRFSLSEARVLYELAHRDGPTAKEIGQDLGIDAGYLSRLLAGFARGGLIARTPSPEDKRALRIHLTAAGRTAFAGLDQASHFEMDTLLGRLPEEARRRLVASLGAAESALRAERSAIVLRPPRPGDVGAIIAGQARLYAEEYGWDITFEALVADICADFFKSHDPACERCWIAECNGAVVGSIFCVRGSDTVAKLRLLYVDQAMRGRGLGTRLVGACIDFARASGYTTMTLWTNDILVAARHIYERFGFVLTAEEKHHSFGHDLVGQTFTLDLMR